MSVNYVLAVAFGCLIVAFTVAVLVHGWLGLIVSCCFAGVFMVLIMHSTCAIATLENKNDKLARDVRARVVRAEVL